MLFSIVVATSISNPAWTAGDKKLAMDEKEVKGIGVKNESAPDRDKKDPGSSKEEDKGNNKVKKNIVKGAGATAAAGIATKKIKSSVKEK